MFKTIGLIAKPNDFTSQETIDRLCLWLGERKIATVQDLEQIKSQADLVIVAGGDGTMLSVARQLADFCIPLLGINLGRLGFLADIHPHAMFETLEAVLAGKSIKEERALLSGNIQENGKIISSKLAFNDVVIHRKQGSKIIEFQTFVNQKFIYSQRADGLIVNTATGSTAYALSSGGPLVHPDVPAISLVPICPHTMSNRPFLVNENSEICIKLSETDMQAVVSFDAQDNVSLTSQQSLVITQHRHRISLIHPEDYNFFNIVRSKLQWSG